MRRISGILLVGLLLIACQNNTEKTTQSKKMVPFDNREFTSVDSMIQSSIDSLKIPGAVALVAHKGNIVLHKAYGFNDLEKPVKLEIDDIFRMASMTKPVTAVAAMMLFEEGKFKLDDPVSKYIPEFAHPVILDKINPKDTSYTFHPAKNEILIKHLFTHSSGIPYGFDDKKIAPLWEKAEISEGFEERDILLADNIKKLAAMPLLHEPGEKYTYGLGLDVIGRMIEIWSGKSLDEFFKERIFHPLGMDDTYFYLPEDKYDRLVKVYMSTDKGISITNYPSINYPVNGAKKFYSGGADLSSTAYDYYLLCQMMLNKGELNGVRILKPETVQLMTNTHLETGDDDMGLGIGVLSAKTKSKLARSVGSYSWGGFFSTTFWIDPEKEVIGILLLQMYPFNHWDIHNKFEDLVYQSIKKE